APVGDGCVEAGLRCAPFVVLADLLQLTFAAATERVEILRALLQAFEGLPDPCLEQSDHRTQDARLRDAVADAQFQPFDLRGRGDAVRSDRKPQVARVKHRAVLDLFTDPLLEVLVALEERYYLRGLREYQPTIRVGAGGLAAQKR